MAADEQHESRLAAEADLAQAFKDLAKGETTASALENHLTSVERKIDDLLASIDRGDVQPAGKEDPEDPAVGTSAPVRAADQPNGKSAKRD